MSREKRQLTVFGDGADFAAPGWLANDHAKSENALCVCHMSILSRSPSRGVPFELRLLLSGGIVVGDMEDDLVAQNAKEKERNDVSYGPLRQYTHPIGWVPSTELSRAQ